MRLTDLDPQFYKYETRVETYQVVDGDPATWRERGCPTRDVTGPREFLRHVDDISQADAVMFLCPKCSEANGGRIGTHYCSVAFEGRGPERIKPKWAFGGTGYDDLTVDPSVLIIGGCAWHGFIKAGQIINV